MTTATEARSGHMTLAGNLTRDPELRFSTKGTAWCTAGLAVNRRRRLDDGGYEELPPEFYELVCFGDLAERVAECLAKGDRVVVTGRVETETWTGHDGTERTTRKLVADDVGASLRFAAVTVERTRRSGPSEPEEGYGCSEEPF